jgi:hypothetical protein
MIARGWQTRQPARGLLCVRELLLDSLDSLWLMLAENALDVRPELTQKIAGCVRADGPDETIYCLVESAIMPRVIGIFQGAGEQRAKDLGGIERVFAVIVLRY